MTQHELIIEYLKEHGSILPAKMAGFVYREQMFGSETSKRCRELRKAGRLRSEGDGRFERFYLTSIPDYSQVSDGARRFLEEFGRKQEVKETNPQLTLI